MSGDEPLSENGTITEKLLGLDEPGRKVVDVTISRVASGLPPEEGRLAWVSWMIAAGILSFDGDSLSLTEAGRYQWELMGRRRVFHPTKFCSACGRGDR